MFTRAAYVPLVILAMAGFAEAQLNQNARYSIIGSLIAAEGAARIPMPLGKTGVELTSAGTINQEKLQKELAENSQAILPGKVVSITDIEFNDKSIEFEIDGGGTKKKNILSNIQVGVGGTSTKQDDPNKKTPDAKGSRITLQFANKLPKDMSAEEIKDLLNPVLDFSKQSMAKTGIEALPPEFQEAVKLKEARVGMDQNTVLLSLGQPNRRIREKDAVGVELEDWIYTGRGRRSTIVTFDQDVVVRVTQH